MTIVAIWYQEEYETHPIWACSDSRISDAKDNDSTGGEPLPLLQHGPKIFPLPIKSIDHTSPSNEIAFEHTVGLAYAGSRLFALNLYAALTPILTNLRGSAGAKVSIRSVAELARQFLREFFRVYGERHGKVAPVNIAFFGFCKAEGVRRVFGKHPAKASPGALAIDQAAAGAQR